MKRHTITFSPLVEAHAHAALGLRRRPVDLTFGVKPDGRILLSAAAWDYVAAGGLGIGTLATLAIASAAHRVGGRGDSWGMFFGQVAAPGLRAEIFGGLDRSVRGAVHLHGALYVGGAPSPITSTQAIQAPPSRAAISAVSHVMAAQLFSEFHATQCAGLAEREA